LSSSATRSIGEFLAVSFPKALGGACTIAVNLWLIRYLQPAEFGVLSLCLVTVLVTDGMLGSPIDLGVIRLATACEATIQRSLNIQKAALLLKGAVMAAGAMALTIWASAISRTSLHDPRPQLAWATLTAIASLLVLRSAQVNLQVERRFAAYGALDFGQMLLKFGGIALLLRFGMATPGGVLIWFITGPAVVAAVWTALHGHSMLRTRPSRGDTRDLLSYTRWFLVTFALAALISRMDLFLLARWGGLREAGIFAAGQAVAWIPQLVGTYLAIVIGPRVMPAWGEGRLLQLIRRFQLGLGATAVAGYVLAMIGLRWLGPLVFPAAFFRSRAVMQALLPGALAGFVTFPLVLTTLMFLRPRFLLLMDCLTLLPLVGLYFLIIPRFGAVGAAWVTTVANVTRATIAQVVAVRCARANLTAGTQPSLISPIGVPVPAGGRLS
jgi:O-antigen/teichoic acid export membrane protein